MSDENPKATSEERAFCMALMWKLWDEWTDSLAKMTPEEKAEEQEYMELFMTRTGATKNSPGYLMFSAFMGGLGKGIELANKLEKAKSPTCEGAQAGQATNQAK